MFKDSLKVRNFFQDVSSRNHLKYLEKLLRLELKVKLTFQIRIAGDLKDHASTVWRVCWNVTGTICATSGNNFVVSENTREA
jgi:hypothetical protein